MRFLLTALGTNNNSTICKYLTKDSKNYVVGADIYPESYIPSTKLTSKFYQVSSVYNMSKYFDQIIDICRQEKIEFLFPVIDEEVAYFSEHIEEFDKIGVRISCSDKQSISICRNKLKTFELVQDKIPEIYTKTVLASRWQPDATPAFMKPISGRASIGCVKIENKQQYEFYKSQLDLDDYIIQEFIEGQFFTVDFINDPVANSFACVARQELVRNKNGCGTVVKIIHDEFLEHVVARIAQCLNYRGIGNCEFIKSDNGKYHLIEINPRLSAGIDYSIRAGFDVIGNIISVIDGGGV